MTRALILLAACTWLGAAGGALAQDHGHDHGPADEVPTVAVTRWTETMELFLEHPELVAMSSGTFTIHLTVLDGFRPVQAGRVTLAFTGPDGARQVRTADTLRRAGVFAPQVGLRDAGVYRLELTYEGPDGASTFVVPEVRVHPSAADVHGHAHGDDEDTVTFLKEQQWQVPFATAEVRARELKQAVWAIGEVLPAPAAYAEITAPVAGVLQAGGDGGLALPGARVARGEVVATIAPPLQGGGWASSRLARAQAEREYERAKRLRARDAISDREFEEAENAYLALQSGHAQLAGRGDGGVLSLTAPLDGQVVAWDVRPGQRLEAGDRLMAVADPSVVWLRVNVYQSDFRGLGTPVGARVGAGPDGWTVPAEALTVLTAGGALDPVTRTVPVLLEIDNTAGRLTINESAPVELYAAAGVTAPAVPRAAVYEDEGLDVVFVQTGGETFAKRVVRLGPAHGDWIGILAGLEPGERVVVRGGYHVKLAGTSAEIGHGHAH